MRITGKIYEIMQDGYPPQGTGEYDVNLEVVFEEKDAEFLKTANHLTDAIIRIAHRGIPGMRL